jgi:hypothetical protein
VLLEISTPFVNLRWCMYDAKMKESQLYTVNGFLMWLTFLFFRIPLVFIIPYYLYITVLEFEAVPRVLFVFCLTNYLLISSLNVYWFYKISYGLLKVVFSKEEVPKAKQSKPLRGKAKEVPILVLPQGVATGKENSSSLHKKTN